MPVAVAFMVPGYSVCFKFSTLSTVRSYLSSCSNSKEWMYRGQLKTPLTVPNICCWRLQSECHCMSVSLQKMAQFVFLSSLSIISAFCDAFLRQILFCFVFKFWSLIHLSPSGKLHKWCGYVGYMYFCFWSVFMKYIFTQTIVDYKKMGECCMSSQYMISCLKNFSPDSCTSIWIIINHHAKLLSVLYDMNRWSY